MPYLYCIQNLKNGKKYIGQTIQTIEKRVNRHKAGEFAIGNAFRKYGEDCFVVGILEETMCPAVLNHLEKKYIKEYSSMYPNGYNLTEGGQHKLSPKSIEKMKQTKLNSEWKPSDKQIEALRQSRIKAVICNETEEQFDSVTSAAKYYGGDVSHLTKLLKGKCKSFHGKTFRYKEVV